MNKNNKPKSYRDALRDNKENNFLILGKSKSYRRDSYNNPTKNTQNNSNNNQPAGYQLFSGNSSDPLKKNREELYSTKKTNLCI